MNDRRVTPGRRNRVNRKRSPAPHQAIVLSYDGQATPTLSVRGNAELTEAILAIACDCEALIYKDAEPVRLLVRLELDNAVPETPYRTAVEIIVFIWYLKDRCPERFTLDAADGSEISLLGGPGDWVDPPGVGTEAPEPESIRTVPAQSTCHLPDRPCLRQTPSPSPSYCLPPAMLRSPRPSSAMRKGTQSPVGTG